MCSRLFIFVIFGFALIVSPININLIPGNSQLIRQSEQGPKFTYQDGLKTEIVSQGRFNFPTSMAFLGPEDILVLEKNEGTIKRIVNGTMLAEPLLDVKVANKNERGLLGIAVGSKNSISHDITDYSKEAEEPEQEPISTYVFLYYTEAKNKDGDDIYGNEPVGNRLYRYELVNDKLIRPKLLLELPTSPAGIHNGGKIITGPDNNIYLTIGDLGVLDIKQQPTLVQNFKDAMDPNGSGGVLRITQNGQVVNAGILGKDHSLNLYFAYGIRNSFGLDFDPVTGNLWDTENGEGHADEINIVKPGFNSGWAKVQGIWEPWDETFGIIFNDTKGLVNFDGKGEYDTPRFIWNETVGPTALKFLNSGKLGKSYQNDLFVGDFHRGYLYHFDLSKDRTRLSLEDNLKDRIANSKNELEDVKFAEGFGGITDLQIGPDGYLYVLALHFGGGNCDPSVRNQPCFNYNGTNIGTIYRIKPVK
jgi:aldose sugar dehydrogenase